MLSFFIKKMENSSQNCTRMILIFVNHTHTHEHSHVYSHEITMKVITGMGVALCVVAMISFIVWLVVRKWHQHYSVRSNPVQFDMDYMN